MAFGLFRVEGGSGGRGPDRLFKKRPDSKQPTLDLQASNRLITGQEPMQRIKRPNPQQDLELQGPTANVTAPARTDSQTAQTVVEHSMQPSMPKRIDASMAAPAAVESSANPQTTPKQEQPRTRRRPDQQAQDRIVKRQPVEKPLKETSQPVTFKRENEPERAQQADQMADSVAGVLDTWNVGGLTYYGNSARSAAMIEDLGKTVWEIDTTDAKNFGARRIEVKRRIPKEGLRHGQVSYKTVEKLIVNIPGDGAGDIKLDYTGFDNTDKPADVKFALATEMIADLAGLNSRNARGTVDLVRDFGSSSRDIAYPAPHSSLWQYDMLDLIDNALRSGTPAALNIASLAVYTLEAKNDYFNLIAAKSQIARKRKAFASQSTPDVNGANAVHITNGVETANGSRKINGHSEDTDGNEQRTNGSSEGKEVVLYKISRQLALAS